MTSRTSAMGLVRVWLVPVQGYDNTSIFHKAHARIWENGSLDIVEGYEPEATILAVFPQGSYRFAQVAEYEEKP